MKPKSYNLQEAIKFYIDNPKYTGTEVANIFNIPRATLAENLRKIDGLDTYSRKIKYFYDRNYFKNIDTPEKAYWIGWIQSDGDVNKRGKIRLRIKAEDEEILWKFAKCLNSNLQVKKYLSKTSYGIANTAELRIDCMEMTKDLNKIGITSKKSFTTKFINFNNTDLQNAYLRGLFDGDGWIYVNKISREIGFCGTENVCTGISKYLKETYDIKSIVSKIKNIYRVRISCKEDMVKMYKIIFEGNEELSLKRKFYKIKAFALSYDSLDFNHMKKKDRENWKAKLGTYEDNLQALLIRGEEKN